MLNKLIDQQFELVYFGHFDHISTEYMSVNEVQVWHGRLVNQKKAEEKAAVKRQREMEAQAAKAKAPAKRGRRR